MIKIIIILLMSFCSSVLAQSQQPNANNEEQHPNNPTSDPIEISSPTLDAIQKSIETIATNTAPDAQPKPNQYNRDGEVKTLTEFDLDAQENMAESTFRMMLISAGALMVSFFALIGLFCNLRQTNKIVKQNRAWIGIENEGRKTPFKDKPTEWGDENYANLLTTLKNYSGTPALDVKVEGGYVVDTEEEITNKPPKTVELKDGKTREIKEQEFANIPPNGLFSFKLQINGSDIDIALDRKIVPRIFIFVGLKVSYKTVYGEDIHVTEMFTKVEALSIKDIGASTGRYLKCGYEEIPCRSRVT